MKYRAKTGTVINIPDGLKPSEIAAIKSDADKGYGLRAQRDANKYGKVSTKAKSAGKTTQNLTPAGKFTPGELAAIQQEFDDALGDFGGEASRTNAEQAAYGSLTQTYDRDRQRELEDAKQELANRGIPYDPVAAQDPNTKNLYGKVVGAVGEKYRGLDTEARRQAILAGNQAYQTDSDVRNAAIDRILGKYKINRDEAVNVYGINLDYKVKNKLANKANSGGGGEAQTGGFFVEA